MRSAVVLVVFAVGAAHADPAWLDTPAWPAASAASLTWRVYPANEDAKSPVEVVVAIGGVQRSVKLAPQLGQMPAIYEHVCGSTAVPLERGERAQITFEEGGFGGYVARVTGPALEIVEWSMSDGMCGTVAKPVPCPRHDKLGARMHVPDGIKLVEHIELVDKHGARHPFVCS